MTKTTQIPLIKVNQWMHSWNNAEWSQHLPEPSSHFFIASISLATLRRLAGVSTRNLSERRDRKVGAGYQRAHQPARSRSIARYVQFGYPLSSQSGLDVETHRTLIHPGWLPTAILVNVVGQNEARRRGGKDRVVDDDCRVSVVESGGNSFLTIPQAALAQGFKIPAASLEPLEIIDGQHRLYAIDEINGEPDIENYEVPVVIFNNLSPSWQAYLFWVINVEPKKINPSLAYDLYPELRNQSWLQAGEGIRVYQEHRAQELTEVLWRHGSSPWKGRIELHGNRVEGHVSNAAFIRSLMVSFVRSWGKEDRIGGLFGSLESQGSERVLPWKRSQQAAFLIQCWQHLLDATTKSTAQWVRDLNKIKDNAFSGANTLLGTDQGVRAILVVFNALCQVAYVDLELESWESERVSDEPDEDEVSEALAEFGQIRRANTFLAAMSKALIDGVDWRTSSAPGLDPNQRTEQSVYRGSSGYVLLQQRCFDALKTSNDQLVVHAAQVAAGLMGR
ncbi:DGQHR domain-containing protein [Burkholderia cepacia]|uniref:DGQHR domain-containing protein n=1 Tax=Burkholderia cepacia TaxID=292 RepID=UPI003A4D2510